MLEGPLRLPADADPEVLEAARVDWEARMRQGQIRAEALLAGAP